MSRTCVNCRVTFRIGATCPLCGDALGAPFDPRVGSVLGDFVLEAHVTTSRHASVYLGHVLGEIDRRVAVKLYHATTRDEVSRRTERELRALGAVRHPSVAALVGHGTGTDGCPYVVTEWIDGPTLAEVLKRGPTSWERVLPILIGMARGLRAIHEAGFVHRDLKPSNVIIPEADEHLGAVIIDLGHALCLTASRLTTTGVVLGTPSYMAPEQASGAVLDGRADLYALGVVLYQALTGELPFADRSPAEVARQHLEEPVTPPGRRAPHLRIPAHAEDLCLWLMAKQPASRLPSARVLEVTLRAARSQIPDEVRP